MEHRDYDGRNCPRKSSVLSLPSPFRKYLSWKREFDMFSSRLVIVEQQRCRLLGKEILHCNTKQGKIQSVQAWLWCSTYLKITIFYERESWLFYFQRNGFNVLLLEIHLYGGKRKTSLITKWNHTKISLRKQILIKISNNAYSRRTQLTTQYISWHLYQ